MYKIICSNPCTPPLSRFANGMNRNNFAVRGGQGLFIQPIRPSLSPELIIKTPCYSITDQGIRQSGIYIGILYF